MVSRESLAAVLRLARALKGVPRDELNASIDPKQLHRLENASTGVTLEKLELVARALDCDPLALLILARSHDEQMTLEESLAELEAEVKLLDERGLFRSIPLHFDGDKLRPEKSGRSLPESKTAAVLNLLEKGMSKKEAAIAAGVSLATVYRMSRGAIP